jgi:1,4-dihydroxy-2-naphthoate octaprenyltransferase
VVAATSCAVAMVVLQPSNWPLLLVFVAIPTSLKLTRQISTETAPLALNRIVRKSAGLHLRFGILVSAGLVLAAITGL